MTNPEVSLRSLSDYPWIVQAHRMPLTFSMVQQSDMIALMPLSLLDFYRNIGALERLPVPLSVHLTHYGLISRRNRTPTASMQLVSEVLREEFRLWQRAVD